MNPLLRKVLGEDERGVIPDDAVTMNKASEVVGKPLKKLVNVVQEPAKPTDSKEKFMTPLAALTAPDCTPDALQPIDPSTVPGNEGPEVFTAKELAAAQPLENTPEAPQTELGSQDPAMRAMDVLLGRRRVNAPAKNPAEFAQAGAAMSESQAQSVVQRMHVGEEMTNGSAKTFASSALTPGAGMPEPTAPTDGRNILNAFRQFV